MCVPYTPLLNAFSILMCVPYTPLLNAFSILMCVPYTLGIHFQPCEELLQRDLVFILRVINDKCTAMSVNSTDGTHEQHRWYHHCNSTDGTHEQHRWYHHCNSTDGTITVTHGRELWLVILDITRWFLLHACEHDHTG